MDSEMITVRTFFEPQEAALAEGMLRANGVQAFINNEASSYPNLEQTAGGIQLRVPAEEVERAVALLEECHAALFADEEEE